MKVTELSMKLVIIHLTGRGLATFIERHFQWQIHQIWNS